MLFGGFNEWISQLRSDPAGTIIEFVFLAVCILTSLIIHECAHGYVALKCGDPTAKMMGRLTLNPMKHLDPIGTICMVVLHVGWAKPVPVNPRNFRHYRRDYIFVSLAGIAVNFILFLLSLTIGVLMIKHLSVSVVTVYILRFLFMLSRINIGLAIFNLIPVPPLDGYRFVNQFLFRGRLDMNPQTMMIIRYVFLTICLTGALSSVLSSLIGGVSDFFLNILYRIL